MGLGAFWSFWSFWVVPTCTVYFQITLEGFQTFAIFLMCPFLVLPFLVCLCGVFFTECWFTKYLPSSLDVCYLSLSLSLSLSPLDLQQTGRTLFLLSLPHLFSSLRDKSHTSQKFSDHVFYLISHHLRWGYYYIWLLEREEGRSVELWSTQKTARIRRRRWRQRLTLCRDALDRQRRWHRYRMPTDLVRHRFRSRKAWNSVLSLPPESRSFSLQQRAMSRSKMCGAEVSVVFGSPNAI